MDRAVKNNPAIQAAEERARAQYLRARGEHRALLPSVDFAAQYARLAQYNNYDQFFATFEANNATIGVVIRFPVFSSVQRAHAQAADAEAVKSKRQAEAAKNQVSEETLKQQRAVPQMEAAQEVAQLEYEVAQSNLESVQTRMDAGTATLKDVADSRGQVTERYITLQDTTFELQRAHIGCCARPGNSKNGLTGPTKYAWRGEINNLACGYWIPDQASGAPAAKSTSRPTPGCPLTALAGSTRAF